VAGRSRPFWGWHRLDRSWAIRLVADAEIRPGALVVDIGAGTGVLTDALLGCGAHVVAVELHRQRVHFLKQRYAGQAVTVVHADAGDLRLPRRRFLVVANPPFVIVPALLRRLLASGSRLEAAHLVVSRYALRRWTSPRAPGAGRWRREFDVCAGRTLPRSAFLPPSPRDAKVLIVRRADAARSRHAQKNVE
jgi:23S rRNA (adenine-N6)-dimethyltransferase